MKLTLLVLSCVVLALVVMACTETVTPTNTSTPHTAAASPSPAASVDEFGHAKANFAKNCEACHGPNGEGGMAKVNNKQIKVPNLHADHAIKHTDEQLTKMITNGEDQMPAFKDKLRPEEISELVRFIRKTFQGKG